MYGHYQLSFVFCDVCHPSRHATNPRARGSEVRRKAEIQQRVDYLEAIKQCPPMVVRSDVQREVVMEPGALNFISEQEDIKSLVDLNAINAELSSLYWVLDSHREVVGNSA